MPCWECNAYAHRSCSFLPVHFVLCYKDCWSKSLKMRSRCAVTNSIFLNYSKILELKLRAKKSQWLVELRSSVCPPHFQYMLAQARHCVNVCVGKAPPRRHGEHSSRYICAEPGGGQAKTNSRHASRGASAPVAASGKQAYNSNVYFKNAD